MANIIRLKEDEFNKLPMEENLRGFVIEKPEDELIAIEKFLILYGRAPETAYRWRNLMYIPERENEA